MGPRAGPSAVFFARTGIDRVLYSAGSILCTRARLQHRRVYLMDWATRSSWLEVCLYARTRQVTCDRTALVMAPHLTPVEQGLVMIAWSSGQSAAWIYDVIARSWACRGIPMVNVTAVRSFMRGRPHRRGKVETCGRKRALPRRNVLSMEAARIKFIKTTRGTRQATWDLLRTQARAPIVDRTTAARVCTREGIGVKLRRCREKPQRMAEHEQERVDLYNKMRHEGPVEPPSPGLPARAV